MSEYLAVHAIRQPSTIHTRANSVGFPHPFSGSDLRRCHLVDDVPMLTVRLCTGLQTQCLAAWC